MRTHLRIFIVVLGALVFWAISMVLPNAMTPATILWLSGVYGVVATLVGFYYHRMNAVTGAGLLASREMERYTDHRLVMRSRMMTVIGGSCLGAVAMWVLRELVRSDFEAFWMPAAIGFFVGLGLQYVLVVVRWINDLAEFEDAIRLRDQKRKQDEALFKRLADARKS